MATVLLGAAHRVPGRLSSAASSSSPRSDANENPVVLPFLPPLPFGSPSKAIAPAFHSSARTLALLYLLPDPSRPPGTPAPITKLENSPRCRYVANTTQSHAADTWPRTPPLISIVRSTSHSANDSSGAGKEREFRSLATPAVLKKRRRSSPPSANRS